MEDEKDKSIAYEMVLLIKENRELKERCEWLLSRVKELEGKIIAKEQAKANAANEQCDQDIHRGDKVVIHPFNKDNQICEGFVIVVNSEPYINKDGYMVLPCTKPNSDGTPMTGKGSALSLTSKGATWEKVDPSTPTTKCWKEGVPGTESYYYSGKISHWKKYNQYYEDLYGGESRCVTRSAWLYAK